MIAGLGIVMYSPSSATGIVEGEDFLSTSFMTDIQIQPHIQAGTIVGFDTSTPGDFVLTFHQGYPTDERIADADYKLRLGLRCDGVVVFRDLYDLMDWTAEFPADQAITLAAGIYQVTLCSDRPASGIVGDNQGIDVYFQRLERFPALATEGVPTLIV